jgi:uncharacterized protein (TIGR02145 family)
MTKAKKMIAIAGVFLLLHSFGNISSGSFQSGGSVSTQTTTKSTQTKTKSEQTVKKPVQVKPKSTQTTSKPVQAKPKSVPGTVLIGTQSWSVANLDVSTFRNGDTIPEAKTNKEWVTAGESEKPAWCYYNNDPANGKKYGKLYNWFAVSDTRGLAPAGWVLPTDADWAKLAYSLGGPESAGIKMKSTEGWIGGNNGDNQSGFVGLPAGYRIENGLFQNVGGIGTWWSSKESKSVSAVDFYLSQNTSLGRSSTPKQRGESVRCLRE